MLGFLEVTLFCILVSYSVIRPYKRYIKVQTGRDGLYGDDDIIKSNTAHLFICMALQLAEHFHGYLFDR